MARAPGRVNLIGEHTDYNGLPVLPMALDREIVLRCVPRADRRVLLRNADARFPALEFELSEDIPAESGGAWGNYARAAGQALWRELGELRGIEGEVSSTLPVASGLSSSSAMVVATAIALLDANARSVPRERLMDLLARGERYVGLQGGGMDQAISLGGVAGCALRIDFRPELRLTPIPIPDAWRIIVAPSLVEARKSAGAKEAYNARVRECRDGLERGTAHRARDYYDLLSRVSVAEALAEVRPQLDDVLFRRFRHVVTEGARVDAAVDALRGADLPAFGALLSASHASLRDNYEVSSKELDELVAISEEAGAAGARLTGAGFGGSIVAVASSDSAAPVLRALEREYYSRRGVASAAFVGVPSAGASVS
ncbi:MAG TPA: galactokinase [Gemmatimonadales bacterium]|nr:galactokinase [Gemmatimonadales bacterium]